MTWDYWRLLADRTVSNASLACQALARSATILLVTLGVYLAVFFVHLTVLQKAGPHDSVMTSAFQASLEVRELFRSDFSIYIVKYSFQTRSFETALFCLLKFVMDFYKLSVSQNMLLVTKINRLIVICGFPGRISKYHKRAAAGSGSRITSNVAAHSRARLLAALSCACVPDTLS